MRCSRGSIACTAPSRLSACASVPSSSTATSPSASPSTSMRCAEEAAAGAGFAAPRSRVCGEMAAYTGAVVHSRSSHSASHTGRYRARSTPSSSSISRCAVAQWRSRSSAHSTPSGCNDSNKGSLSFSSSAAAATAGATSPSSELKSASDLPPPPPSETLPIFFASASASSACFVCSSTSCFTSGVRCGSTCSSWTVPCCSSMPQSW
mmetsp:Transcript_25873/g.64036  ORF Transcript_25873/g.64036 Transcript_25873/m.64036 type:complete len:207 (-) Transcript_25873:881-1501(-)